MLSFRNIQSSVKEISELENDSAISFTQIDILLKCP